MKAIGKYIVIEPTKEKDVKTKGGLILANTQREDVRYREAKVITVGSDVKAVKKGNMIYFIPGLYLTEFQLLKNITYLMLDFSLIKMLCMTRN